MAKVPKETIVVLDEAYYEYAQGEEFPEAINWLDRYPNLVITRTFSKIYGLAGLRLRCFFSILSTDTLIVSVMNFSLSVSTTSSSIAPPSKSF